MVPFIWKEIHMGRYVIQDTSLSVDRAIDAMFAGYPVRGWTSPRQAWLRTLVSLAALGPERASSALDLWNCALIIAKRARGEQELRPLHSIHGTFLEEMEQFDAALASWEGGRIPFVKLVSRLSNILYYALQAYVQEYDMYALNAVSTRFCERVGISE